MNINQTIQELEALQSPEELLKEIFTRFGDRAAIGTSGQLTGVALIHMACSQGLKPRVFTIDTLRLFDETYELFQELEKKYGIRVEKVGPDPKALSAMVDQHGEYLFFDSKEKQELCCKIRKVDPNEKILETVDVWITGLRSDQSSRRSSLPRLQTLQVGPQKRTIIKVAPLMNWKEAELREYIAKNKIPTHKLLDWNQNGWFYESLGCKICTTPIGPTEARRAGRWRWFNGQDANKECGLHVEIPDEV